jgi:hypothetical protein
VAIDVTEEEFLKHIFSVLFSKSIVNPNLFYTNGIMRGFSVLAMRRI